MDENIWLDFDPNTERVYIPGDGSIENNQPIRIQVPARVIALRTLDPTDEEVAAGDTFGTRNKLAAQYAAEGDIVDPQIDVWGWGAANTYAQRRGYGYKTTPDVFGRNQICVPPDPIPSNVI